MLQINSFFIYSIFSEYFADASGMVLMRLGGDGENRGRPWPREREGPAAQQWEGFSFQITTPSASGNQNADGFRRRPVSSGRPNIRFMF